jgi:heterodisulfide reductase subunit A-like polyferredoxin
MSEPVAAKESAIVGSVLVAGGGVGGVQASLDLADAGYFVYLVERSPVIGGAMAQLDKTFPHQRLLHVHPFPQAGGMRQAPQH